MPTTHYRKPLKDEGYCGEAEPLVKKLEEVTCDECVRRAAVWYRDALHDMSRVLDSCSGLIDD